MIDLNSETYQLAGFGLAAYTLGLVVMSVLGVVVGSILAGMGVPPVVAGAVGAAVFLSAFNVGSTLYLGA